MKLVIRTRFWCSRADKVSSQIRTTGDAYLNLSNSISREQGATVVEVPPMLGVDEDMRNWSFYMLLEHHVIVNRSITNLIEGLVRGEVIEGIDPKKDVMPSADPGVEQVEVFRSSIEAHIETIARLGKLRGTVKKRHPIFGMLDAHGWHCMFGLHLEVHMKQAQLVASQSTATRATSARG